jgi:predicted dehydrogenase
MRVDSMPEPDAAKPAPGAESEPLREVRVAVIGVGHLGKNHARILSELPGAKLVAIVDNDGERAAEFAKKFSTNAARDYRHVPGDPEAVCVAVPTPAHAAVAGHFLEKGIDVFVEKPITVEPSDAMALTTAAEMRSRILQVGHVERFNPIVQAVGKLGIKPRYIEAHRMAPFSFRSVESGVVLDLMIHDIDLMLWLLGTDLSSVDSFGGAIFTPAEDMASAIFKFKNGGVAHLTANRVALKPLRRMRLFSHDSYVSMDFGNRYGLVVRKAAGWDLRNLDLQAIDVSSIQDLWKYVFEGLLEIQEINVPEGEPLRLEMASFLNCVRHRRQPAVGGREGLAALEIAHRVLDAVKRNKW